MNKSELVDRVYKQTDLQKQECREGLDTTLETIVETVASGEKVLLVNFGTFVPSPKPKTHNIHPLTGERIEIPPKVVPKFRAGKGFLERVKGNLEVKRDGSGKLKVKKK